MVKSGFYYGGKMSDLVTPWDHDDYINTLKLTDTSLCGAILEREAQETRGAGHAPRVVTAPGPLLLYAGSSQPAVRG